MDTTVILAQPRVSRLRADVVYVDRSGSGRARVGLGSANGRSCFFIVSFLAGTPPFELLHHCGALQKKLKNGLVASPDLVTFSASGVHPVYAYYFHPQHGEGYNPLWYDPQLGGTPPIH